MNERVRPTDAIILEKLRKLVLAAMRFFIPVPCVLQSQFDLGSKRTKEINLQQATSKVQGKPLNFGTDK